MTKNSLLTLCSIVLAAICLSTTVLAQVANPGFENGSNLSPWTSTGNCAVASYLGVAHSGTYYFNFNGNNASPNGVLSQVINTTPGTSYTLTFWQGLNLYNTSASEKINVTVTGSGTLATQSFTISASNSGSL